MILDDGSEVSEFTIRYTRRDIALTLVSFPTMSSVRSSECCVLSRRGEGVGRRDQHRISDVQGEISLS